MQKSRVSCVLVTETSSEPSPDLSHSRSSEPPSGRLLEPSRKTRSEPEGCYCVIQLIDGAEMMTVEGAIPILLLGITGEEESEG